ncbi:MAG: hypothetical protein WCK34_18770 [Bacteroidota bacterium]
MKNRVIAATGIMILLLPGLIIAGKQERKHKVKSATTTTTVYENGKASSSKDSYEEFDRNGNTTLSIGYGKDGTVLHKETTVYDKAGNVTEEVVTDTKENKSYRMTYTYTVIKDKTLLAEESEFTSAGTLKKKTVYTYNASKKKATETVTDGTGQPVKKVIYSYNSRDLKSHKQVIGKTNMPESAKDYQYEYY